MLDERIRAFYSSHSVTSDPGAFSSAFDGMPEAVEDIIDVIGGVLVHPMTVSDPDDPGAGELTMEQTLCAIHAIDPAPLVVRRPVGRRLRVNCRGFAMLFVAILRSQGVPVRKRVGFDWDRDIHEIAEYWDVRRNRWEFVDPNPASRKPIREFRERVGENGAIFHSGSIAWFGCRSGREDAESFHDSAYAGMAGVRVALLQDLDSLNKIELRSYDEWHELIYEPWDQVADASLRWLDRAAELVNGVDIRFDELRAFYTDSAYGSAVQGRLTARIGRGGR